MISRGKTNIVRAVLRVFFTVVVIGMCALGFSSCSSREWEDYEHPFSLGEGMTYRSTVFKVKKPTSTPFPVKVDDKYAYSRNTHGTHAEWCTEAVFDFAKPVTEGLAAVKRGDKWGYIRILPEEGDFEFVIEPRFESAEPFSEGLAAVKVEGKYGYIDPNGEMIIEPKFVSAHYFSGGLAAAETEDGWIFINRNGEPAFGGVYECAESFTAVYASQSGQHVVDIDKTLAPVRINGKWGYINLKGQIAIKPMFDEAWAFEYDGKAAVKINGKWKHINTRGEIM
ncbi:WG repeat-containing protein [Mahella australiensis]|nr:WG repeat-containing protein [Mahella australiensis]